MAFASVSVLSVRSGAAPAIPPDGKVGGERRREQKEPRNARSFSTRQSISPHLVFFLSLISLLSVCVFVPTEKEKTLER